MRIVALIQLRQQTKLVFNENPDAELEIPASVKQAWNARIDALVADIKAVVGTW